MDKGEKPLYWFPHGCNKWDLCVIYFDELVCDEGKKKWIQSNAVLENYNSRTIHLEVNGVCMTSKFHILYMDLRILRPSQNIVELHHGAITSILKSPGICGQEHKGSPNRVLGDTNKTYHFTLK